MVKQNMKKKRRKQIRKLTAGVLSLSLMVTSLSVPATGEAKAKKPVLSSSKKTMQVGEEKTIRVKDVKKSRISSLTLKTSGKSVVKVKKKSKTKFTVTAKKVGTATVTAKVKLKRRIAGKRNYSLKLKVTVVKPDESTKSTPGTETVPTASAVTASPGTEAVPEATGTPEPTAAPVPAVTPEPTEKPIQKVEVNTQEELEAALQNAVAEQADTELTIGQKTRNLTIPSWNYNMIDLIVDAPNADIVNHGIFKSILIKAIATDTWTEHAFGNKIVVYAAAGRVVIPKEAMLDEVVIKSDNSNFIIEVQGSVKNLVVDGTSNVRLKVSGEVSGVQLNNRTKLDIEGQSEKTIPVKIGEKADGTQVTSNTAVSVETNAVAEINLQKGAEGSSVKADDEGKKVEVTNNTTGSVNYTTPQGANKTLATNANATYDGTGNIVASTTNGGGSGGYSYSGGYSGGGSSSGGSGGSSSTGNTGNGDSGTGDSGSSSSGDLIRRVTSFVRPDGIDGGVFGESVKTLEEVKALLPTTVTGKTNTEEEVVFPVTEWIAPEEYRGQDSAVGNYIFTAVLGTPETACTVDEGIQATVVVNVWAGGDIVYSDYTLPELQKLTLKREIGEDENILYCSVKNETGKDIWCGNSTISFYQNGNKKAEYPFGIGHLDKGKTEIVSIVTEGIEYTSYQVNCHVSNNSGGDASDETDLEISHRCINSEGGYKIVELSITNNSNYLVRYADIQIIRKKGNKIVGMFHEDSFRDIPAGATKKFEVKHIVEGNFLEYWQGNWEADEDVEINYLHKELITDAPISENGTLQYSQSVLNSDRNFEILSDNIGEENLFITLHNDSSKNYDLVSFYLYLYKDDVLQARHEFPGFNSKPIDKQSEYIINLSPSYTKGIEYNQYVLYIECAYENDEELNNDPEVLATVDVENLERDDNGKIKRNSSGLIPSVVTVTNNSEYNFTEVDYQIILENEGKVIGFREETINNLSANGNIQKHINLFEGGNFEIDNIRVNIFHKAVDALSVERIETIRNGDEIQYSAETALALQNFTLLDKNIVTKEERKYLFFEIKNENDEEIYGTAKIYLYNGETYVGTVSGSLYYDDDRSNITVCAGGIFVLNTYFDSSFTSYKVVLDVQSKSGGNGSVNVQEVDSMDNSKISQEFTNTGTEFINYVYYQVVYKKEGKTVFVRNRSLANIPVGDSKVDTFDIDDITDGYTSYEIYILHIETGDN